jgi:hypothetical protein
VASAEDDLKEYLKPFLLWDRADATNFRRGMAAMAANVFLLLDGGKPPSAPYHDPSDLAANRRGDGD